MTWNFVAGDKYSLQQLQDFRVFFYQDFLSAEAEVTKHKELEKWGLPNWRLGMIRRKLGLEEAERNLIIVNQAISEL